MNTVEIIAKNVRLLRTTLNLTQSDVAERANVTQAYIGKIENGQGNITMEVLGRLATALEVTPRELISKMDVVSQAA